jgi:RNA polymerase sigma-70 factor, ECF subfamily
VSSQANSTVRFNLDFDLVKRAQHGDSDAFASLFHSHKGKVYSICLRMTKNTTEAEDLTQEAFMQVFRKLSTFRAEAALSTWLYRIAVNTVLMHFRKKTRQYISLDEPYNQGLHLVHREYGSRDDSLSGCVHRIALTRAICELPDGYRRIFLLHEVGGYEHQEIADLLDCSIGNSKSQLHKAKRKIREFLGGVRAEDQQKKQQDVSDSRDTTSYAVSNSPPAQQRPTVGMTSRFVAQTALDPEISGFAATS